MRLAFALLLVSPVLAGEFTAELWSRIQPVYRKTIAHPFLAGIVKGDLPRSRFEFYLVQDSLYLDAFSRALNILAAKAPREEWALILSRHAVEAIEVERQFHQSVIGYLANKQPMAPTNRAYTNHLIATAAQRPFVEGLAAVLPCYWIYWEVGKELKKKGSPNPDYQRWIDQYAAEGYGNSVRQVLDMMNAEAGTPKAASLDAVARLFEISARYEYMFWDMAWRQEQWPP